MMNGSDSTMYLGVICVMSGVLVFLIAFAILKKTFSDRIEMKARMKKLFGEQKIELIAIKNTVKKKKIEKIKLGKALANELQAADIPIRSEELLTIWLLLAFVPSGIIAITSGNMLFAFTAAIMGIGVVPFVVSNKKKKKTEEFENQLSDALVVICNCLRSGLTLGQAMENIAREMSDPIAKEFARVCREIKYGTSIENALLALNNRIKSDDLMLAVSAINIQRQVGGNLSNILETISETIKARIKLKQEIKVLTATGRASGLVISILPIGMGLLLTIINPSYMMLFFQHPTGRVMIAVGAVMEVIGILVVKKIVTVKY
ncbi:MAG: type II secretion system F family protein [Monoglobales bacterium]